jgi:hypothetical protein
MQVRWESSSTKPAEEYTSFYGKGNESDEWGTSFSVHKRIMSAVKRVQSLRHRMSYMILRGHWFHILVLNIHDPIDKIDDVKDS